MGEPAEQTSLSPRTFGEALVVRGSSKSVLLLDGAGEHSSYESLL